MVGGRAPVVDREIRQHEVRVVLVAGRHQRPVGADHEARAVEDELVLAADLVDVGDGAPGLRHPLSEHLESLRASAT